MTPDRIPNQVNYSVTPDKFDAVLFDLDGVLTATAKVHASCWKKTFDEFLQQHAKENDIPFQAFEIETDYKLYVDGKPRYEGVKSFLESRNIHLPQGSLEDDPTAKTVCGVGNRKNEFVHLVLETEGVEVYSGSVDWVKHLMSQGIKTAVVSSSKNCEIVLKAAGIIELFKIRVDGKVAAQLNIPGKPAPDTFLKAAEMLGIEPKRAVVVEDAISGVQAGSAGGFGLVIGVDREGDAQALQDNGADIVVSDLSEMLTNSSTVS